MKVGIYCRVSSEEQKIKGNSLRDQESRGIEYCLSNGYEYEVFSDGGYSGETQISDRPSLFSLLQKSELIKNKNFGTLVREIDAIYITDFDRLSRNEETGLILKNHFIVNKIIFIENGKVVDLNDSTQSLIISIKNSLSSYETKKLRERIKRNLERGVIEGRVGGGLLTYGYKRGENKQLEIDEYESDVVKYVFRLSIQGNGTKVISKILNEEGIKTKRMIVGDSPMKVKGEQQLLFIWRDSVVYKMLNNTIYKGERNFKGKIYNSPIIISKDEFDLSQRLMKERKHFKNTTNKYFYLLKGLIICPRCKNRFYGRKREDLSDNQYICCSQRYSEFCGNRGINIDRLNSIVWDSLLNLPEDIKGLVDDDKATYIKGLKNNITKLSSEIQINKNKIDKLLDLFTDNDKSIIYIKNRIDILSNKIEASESRLRLRIKELNLVSNYSEIIFHLKQNIKPFKKKNIDDLSKQNLIRIYVKSIIVNWHESLNKHIILIDYSLSNQSEIMYEKTIELNYKKNGWRYDVDGLEYKFRKLSNKIVYKKNGDDIKEISISENESSFSIKLNDNEYREKGFVDIVDKKHKDS
jgi:site-specific DNA recombinase